MQDLFQRISGSGKWTQKLNLELSFKPVENKLFSIIWKLIFPAFVFNLWKKSNLIFIGSNVWYAKSLPLVTFFIKNKAFYKIQLEWVKLASPIHTLNWQIFHQFLPANNLFHIKYHIVVHRHTFFPPTILQPNHCVR